MAPRRSAPPVSAGIVVFRRRTSAPSPAIEILLVHPGGPYWAAKDEHGWSIPKGEIDQGEDPETAAIREFTEELGHTVPDGLRRPLPPFRAGKKTIHAWLIEGDLDPESITSNEIDIEWPPRSGRVLTIPEVDRAEWMPLERARTKLHKGQLPLVDLIEAALGE